MSILIAGLTSDKKDYCLEIFLRQITSFTYPNYDTFLVDNSKNPLHLDEIWKWGIDATRVEPRGTAQEYLCESQNLIRDKVLYEGYEWLFLLDSDVFMPLNILDYLMVKPSSVHSFVYFIDPVLCEVGQGTNETIRMEFDVNGTGLGCILIHRDIPKEITFRTEDDLYSDYFFFQDLKQLGVKPVIDTNIIPAHYRSEHLLTDLKVLQ